MQKGFITIPILIIAILGITVVGGGGYAVYKVSEIQQESNDAVAQLEERLEQMVATTTLEVGDEIEQVATTSESVSTTSEEMVEESLALEVQTEPEVATAVYVAPIAPVVETYVPPAPVDLCLNMTGLQATIPSGYKASGSNCEQIEDKCENVSGIQESVPTGMLLTREYGCILESDLDRIEEQKREIEKAEKLADKQAEECEDAEDDLAAAEKEYEKYQKILDGWPSGAAITQEYQEASIKAVGAVNKMSILQSGVSAACSGVYYAPTTVDYDDLMPEGPIYTDCYYDGWGTIQCTSY